MLVVGAGPGGSGAALSLARSGVRPLVIDRASFPRDKVCGDGLPPRAVAALQRLGLEEALHERGYRPVKYCRIVGTGGGHLLTDLAPRNSFPGYSYVVPRRELDHLLVTTMRERGVEVWEGVQALGLLGGERTSVVRAVDGEGEALNIRAQVIIAADGSRGSFSRHAAPARHFQTGGVAIRLYMDGVSEVNALCFFLDRRILPGYGWVFPGGADGLPANVGVGLDASALRSRKVGLRSLLRWFVGPGSLAWPHLSRARAVSAPAAFPLQLNYWQGVRRCGRMLFVGDAANLVSPLSGEGVAYALESGEEAARATVEALRSGDIRRLAGYDSAVRRLLAADYLGAYLLRRALVHPMVNNAMVGLLRRDQKMARGGVGILTNTVSPLHLLHPGLWARMLSPRRLARLLAS